MMQTISDRTIRFAAVLGHRAGHRLRLFEPDAIAEALEQTGVDARTAHDLAWGLGGTLSTSEVERLCRHFAFHTPLVSLLFNPTSAEVADQTIADTYHALNTDTCEQCRRLATDVERFFENRDDADADELLLDLIEHLLVVS